MGEVAFDYPEAQRFASDLCQRIAQIARAYTEILEEVRPTDDASGGERVTLRDELRKTLRIAEIFGNSSQSSGSVGMSILAIQVAIEGGNLREQMTLAYSSLFSFIVKEVLANPDMVRQINEKLDGFQIDQELLQSDTEAGRGLAGTMLTRVPLVEEYRTTEKARHNHATPAIGEGPRGPKPEEVYRLSERERLVGLEYELKTNERRLEWISGEQWFYADPASKFAREARELGGLPIATGPSGTTDGFLHVATYLGLGDRLEEGLLACIGWMVLTRDHTLHEIRAVGNEYGISYSGKPSDFKNLYSKDPQVMRSIDARLSAEGKRNPSYYFSGAYQMLVATIQGSIPSQGPYCARRFAGILDDPPHGHRATSIDGSFDRDLVGGTSNSAGLHLEADAPSLWAFLRCSGFHFLNF